MNEASFRHKAGRYLPGRLIPRRLGYVHVFLAGLVLRLLYLWQASHGNEILDYPIVDASVYFDWAQKILAGHFLWSEPINYTPMYPFYLAFWLFFFGNATCFIFLVFHALGAVQAVVIGRAAEALWDRKTGLIAGFIAALYWPFIVIEATFFCENLALWTLSLGLFFLCRYSNGGTGRGLFGAGFFIAVAGLCRANMLLCLPVIACWMALDAARAAIRADRPTAQAVGAGLRSAAIFLLPILAMSVPIMYWNHHRGGAAILRTQAGVCLFVGNNPDFDGLIVPPGIEWENLSNEPLRAGRILIGERERFWTKKTVEIVRNRTRAWLVLQARKLSMLLGSREISQEIDTYRFRGFSPALALPLWPGFGFVAPFAIAGIALAVRARRKNAAPLVLFAAAYFCSVFPFQAAARFRLPLALALVPFAASFIAAATRPAAPRDRRRAAAALAGLAVLFALVIPDYTGVRERNVIRHEYFVGEKRCRDGDMTGAMQALARSAALYPDDADSLLLAGDICIYRGNTARAAACFAEAQRRQPRNPPALMGLARCAIIEKQFDRAETLLRSCLAEWPNSLEALSLLNDICFIRADWPGAEEVLTQMHTYVSCPVVMTFRLALVKERLGSPGQAVALYDRIAGDRLQDRADRARAEFLAAALLWRHDGNAAAALARWRKLAAGPPGFFTPLAARLAGNCDDEALLAAYGEKARNEGRPYITYTLGLAAWMGGDIPAARDSFEKVIGARQARTLKPWKLSVPEYWALEDLARLEQERGPVPNR